MTRPEECSLIIKLQLDTKFGLHTPELPESPGSAIPATFSMVHFITLGDAVDHPIAALLHVHSHDSSWNHHEERLSAEWLQRHGICSTRP
jgi:hypothetical protein